MTVTLQLSPEMMERAHQIAEEREIDLSSFLAQVIEDYLEEQEDLAEARERIRQIQEGKSTPRPWSEVRAELLSRAED